MEDVEFSSARAVAAAIASRQISSREVLDHLLDRIAKLDGAINAVVTIDGERARAEATAADDMVARGDELGPLHGVPMTVKDSWETAGMRTTSGAPELREHVPERDAWPVAALRAAGAVVFGKTNLPYYAGDCQTYNDVFGTTNNPFDPERTCSGSSGGSGAALACGFTPLELGSDIGGSIRSPAHVNGVVGHKPSFGIVPSHGHIPGPPGSLSGADIAVGGPMARTVEDCALAPRRARRSGPVEHAGVAAGAPAAAPRTGRRLPRRSVVRRPGVSRRPRRRCPRRAGGDPPRRGRGDGRHRRPAGDHVRGGGGELRRPARRRPLRRLSEGELRPHGRGHGRRRGRPRQAPDRDAPP